MLATVIGHQREKGWIITDAGWMAMSRDRGTAKQKVDQGYGLVCDARAGRLADLIVADANQEHGIVRRPRGGALDSRTLTRSARGCASFPTTPARPRRSTTPTTS